MEIEKVQLDYDDFVKHLTNINRKMSRSEMDKLKSTAVIGDAVLDDNDDLYVFDGKEFIKYDKKEWKEKMIFRRYIDTVECSIYPVDIDFSSLDELFKHEYFDNHKKAYSLTNKGFVKFKNFVFSNILSGYLILGSVKPSDENILNDMDIIKSKGTIFFSSSNKSYNDYDELKTILESLGDFINFNDKECTK